MNYNRTLLIVILTLIFCISLYFSLGIGFNGDFKNITINDLKGDLKNILLNLASEVLGIVIAVFLVEKTIKEEAEAKRRRLLQTVFHRLTVKSELSLMMSLARPAAPKESITNYLDIYKENYYEYVRKLDFSAEGPGRWSKTNKAMSWSEYIR
jgi:hypothetical protein